MSPLEINEQSDATGPDASACGRRASLKGFLSMSLSKYLELLHWTGRQLRSGKRGTIPSALAPILERLGWDTVGWCDLVTEAARRGQCYRQAPGVSLLSASGG
ncbi:MAG: hypothetical protein O3C40_29965 [Planctomycetota bacterium]|nr:hypothetical protein [Planctomycetota bacterium]